MGRHALIIEDEILIAMEIETMLEELGFESFDIADRPSEALAAALTRRPDLITADYRIIEGTGLDAVGAIEAAIGKAKVVYVTGNPSALAAVEGARIVDKPILPWEFHAVCADACNAC